MNSIDSFDSYNKNDLMSLKSVRIIFMKRELNKIEYDIVDESADGIENLNNDYRIIECENMRKKIVELEIDIKILKKLINR